MAVAERTGKTIWVVRVEYANGNRRWFGFEDEGEAARFRDQVYESSTITVRRVQAFDVPLYSFVEEGQPS